MGGLEFQRKFCKRLWNDGYWALEIARDSRGAQPFDVLAMKDNHVLAVDCKVCSSKGARFPLTRIEDNQWSAFMTVSERTDAIVGIVVWYDESVYFVHYETLFDAYRHGDKSINILSDGMYWFYIGG